MTGEAAGKFRELNVLMSYHKMNYEEASTLLEELKMRAKILGTRYWIQTYSNGTISHNLGVSAIGLNNVCRDLGVDIRDVQGLDLSLFLHPTTPDTH